jgi:hypothetical protein
MIIFKMHFKCDLIAIRIFFKIILKSYLIRIYLPIKYSSRVIWPSKNNLNNIIMSRLSNNINQMKLNKY